MNHDVYRASRVIDAARALHADALTRCHAADRSSDENIHEIRKDLKKVRAYWRLMRYALGKRHSKAGNERCKQAAAQLSGARDQAVMLGTLDALASEAGSKTAMAIGQAKQAMCEAADTLGNADITWDQVVDLIRNDDAAWSGLDASAIAPDDLHRGWKRTRRKARRGCKQSRQHPDGETLHSWRKWIKRWLEQEKLLHPGKAKRLKRLDALCDLLGMHHDLVVLSERLWRNDHFGGEAQQRVRRAIARRRAGLEKRALKLGGEALG